MSSHAMPLPANPGFDKADIRRLVETFYSRVRQDAQLGPIFEARVGNWDEHFDMLTEFWSALLLGTRDFKGAPIPKHAAIPDLSWPLFEHWLELFRQTTQDIGIVDLKAAADMRAEKIAAKLWEVYQARKKGVLPEGGLASQLPPGLVRYGESPVFTPDNLPEKLKNAHTTKAGTWGLLRVDTGIVQFSLDVAPFSQAVVTAGNTIVIEPEVPHHVEFHLPGRFQIEFWRRES